MVSGLTWGGFIELETISVVGLKRKQEESEQRCYKQLLKSINKPISWSHIYSLPTNKLPAGLPLGGGLVLILRLLCQGCTIYAHVKDGLSSELVNLDYHCALLYTELPRSPTDVQCFFHRNCKSSLCMPQIYWRARISQLSNPALVEPIFKPLIIEELVFSQFNDASCVDIPPTFWWEGVSSFW